MKQIKKILEQLKQITPVRKMIFLGLCIIANSAFLGYLTELRRSLVVSGKLPLRIPILWFIFMSIQVMFIISLMYSILFFLLNKLEEINKEMVYKRCKEKLSEKLSENEFTEVFFAMIKVPSGKAGDYYWAMKRCTAPRWFAKWREGEKIYVVLKDGEKEVRNWTIENLIFFDFYFEFDQ